MNRYFILIMALFVGFQIEAMGQCAAGDTPQVLITSIGVTSACDGDPPLQNSMEPTLSIGGTVVEYNAPGSCNEGVLGCDAVAGVWPAFVSGNCSGASSFSLSAWDGVNPVCATVESWEEDGCGACSYGTGSFCNDDANHFGPSNVCFDPAVGTGSFGADCFTWNYIVGCPTAPVYSGCGCSNCPQPLPDGANENFFINISDSGTDGSTTDDCGEMLTGINLNFDHTYLGDLQISVTSPCGGTAILMGPIDFTGGGGTYDLDFADFYPQWVNAGQGSTTGTYSPYSGTIAGLNCTNNCGTWTLNVLDNQDIDTGNFIDFQIAFGDADGDNAVELSCNSDPTCLGNADFVASTDICDGDAPTWTPGGLCDITGSFQNGVVVDLYVYDADGDGLPDVGGAPAGYAIDVTSPTHTGGGYPDGSGIEDRNPDISVVGFDFNCTDNLPVYSAIANQTCEVQNYTFFLTVFDWNLETNDDGLCTGGADCAEYDPNCTAVRYDVTVYPKPIVSTSQANSCGANAKLVAADGTVCITEPVDLTTDCAADIAYDFSAFDFDPTNLTGNSPVVAADFPATCPLTGVTGTVPCTCCTAPDIEITTAETVICDNTGVISLSVTELVAGTGTVDSYTWTGDVAGLDVTNAATVNFDPAVSGTGSFTLTVTITTDDGCSNAASIIILVQDASACCPAKAGKF